MEIYRELKLASSGKQLKSSRLLKQEDSMLMAIPALSLWFLIKRLSRDFVRAMEDCTTQLRD